MATLETINDDCLAIILSYLPVASIVNLYFVNSRFEVRIESDWKFISSLIWAQSKEIYFQAALKSYLKCSYGLFTLSDIRDIPELSQFWDIRNMDKFHSYIKRDLNCEKLDNLNCFSCMKALMFEHIKSNVYLQCQKHKYKSSSTIRLLKLFLNYEITYDWDSEDLVKKHRQLNPYLDDNFYFNRIVVKFEEAVLAEDELQYEYLYSYITENFQCSEKSIIFSDYENYQKYLRKRYRKDLSFSEYRLLVYKRRYRSLWLQTIDPQIIIAKYENNWSNKGQHKYTSFKQLYETNLKWCKWVYNELIYHDEWQEFIDYYEAMKAQEVREKTRAQFIIVDPIPRAQFQIIN